MHRYNLGNQVRRKMLMNMINNTLIYPSLVAIIFLFILLPRNYVTPDLNLLQIGMRAHEVIQDGRFSFKLLYFFVNKQSLTASLKNTRDRHSLSALYTESVTFSQRFVKKFVIHFLLNREMLYQVLLPPLMP